MFLNNFNTATGNQASYLGRYLSKTNVENQKRPNRNQDNVYIYQNTIKVI